MGRGNGSDKKMEAKTHRRIKDGKEYNHFFPAADLIDETVKKGATVSDTVKFIPKVVRETLPQTKKIAKELQEATKSETCKNIWHFVYNHINYQKDDEGAEQIRSPARTWNDRHRGVDCDCYTVFISSILSNLKIPHKLRIAKYKKDHFQHIYPVVPMACGRYITIDCVVDFFNYEEPYTEIKDTTMDLQYLSGISEDEQLGDDLGRKKVKDFLKRSKPGGFFQKVTGGGKIKKVLKKTVHIANRANPATLLLRTGVLASMKLNIFKVAQRLKWAYLSEDEAKKRGVNMDKFQKLKKIKDKLESIFYGAGGKPENLKKAILTGRGNRNHEVSGLAEMNESTPIPQLLGEEIFYSENDYFPIEGYSESTLGEPVTAASITAASGAIASIAALLKSIGSIFPKKEKGSEDFENTETEGDEKNLPAEIEKNKAEIEKLDTAAEKESTDKPDSSGDGEDDAKEGFWEKNKKWLKPTMWGAGGLGLLYMSYRVITGKKNERPPAKALSGTKHKKHHKEKKEIALM